MGDDEPPYVSRTSVSSHEKRENGTIHRTDSQPARLWARWRDGWTFQIASAAASAACLVAMIVFLRVLDNKEVPSWNNRVSPNAILAVASTAVKAAMIVAISEAIGQFKWLHLRQDGHR